MEKPLPIVEGCLALAIRGRLTGRTVLVVRRAPLDAVVSNRGVKATAAERGYVNPWFIKHPTDTHLYDKDGHGYRTWLVSEADLMRIDGNKSRFLAENLMNSVDRLRDKR